MSTKRIIIATILSLIIFAIGIGIGIRIGIARKGAITIAHANHNATGRTSTMELRDRSASLSHHDLEALVAAQHTVLTVDVHSVL